MKNVYVAVDVLNLYHSVNKKYEGGRLDFQTYLQSQQARGVVKRAVAYGIEKDYKQTLPFKDALRGFGYIVRYLTTDNHFVDNNMNIIFDTIRCLEMFDTFILGSSDFRLVPLVKFLKEKGKEVIVASCYIPKELKIAADSYHDLGEQFVKYQGENNDLGTNERSELEPEDSETGACDVSI